MFAVGGNRFKDIGGNWVPGILGVQKWLAPRLVRGIMQKVDDPSQKYKSMRRGDQVSASVAPLLLRFGAYQEPLYKTRSEALSLSDEFSSLQPFTCGRLQFSGSHGMTWEKVLFSLGVAKIFGLGRENRASASGKLFFGAVAGPPVEMVFRRCRFRDSSVFAVCGTLRVSGDARISSGPLRGACVSRFGGFWSDTKRRALRCSRGDDLR